jgi:hypothetical protein
MMVVLLVMAISDTVLDTDGWRLSSLLGILHVFVVKWGLGCSGFFISQDG